MDTLTKCPRCGYKRFDPVAGACERRACGFEEPCPHCGTTVCAEAKGPDFVLMCSFTGKRI